MQSGSTLSWIETFALAIPSGNIFTNAASEFPLASCEISLQKIERVRTFDLYVIFFISARPDFSVLISRNSERKMLRCVTKVKRKYVESNYSYYRARCCLDFHGDTRLRVSAFRENTARADFFSLGWRSRLRARDFLYDRIHPCRWILLFSSAKFVRFAYRD